MKKKQLSKVKTLPISKNRDSYKEITDFLLRAMDFNHSDDKLYKIVKDNFKIDGRKLRPLIQTLRKLQQAKKESVNNVSEEEHLRDMISRQESLYNKIMDEDPDKASKILERIDKLYYRLMYSLKSNRDEA